MTRTVYNTNLHVEVIGGYNGILSVTEICFDDTETVIFYTKRADISKVEFNENDSTIVLKPISNALKMTGVGRMHIPKDALFHISPSTVSI